MIRRSLTLLLGLLLTVGAFLGFLLWGRLANPPPYRVVVAVENIPPFTELREEMFVVDEQIISPQVAQRYVLEEELEVYLRAVPIESLYIGEPLTKNRLLLSDPSGSLWENPRSLYRLSLGLDDPSMVAMVIPLDGDSSVSELAPGDHVNIEFAAGGQGATPSLMAAPSEEEATGEEEEVVLPLAKTLLQRVPVLRVNFEQIPNPNYGLGAGFDGTSGAVERPFLKGEIESIVVLIPESEQEMLTFALENGAIRVALVSPLAVEEPMVPLPGVMWPDFVERFLGERGAAATYTVTDTYTITPPTGIPWETEVLPLPTPEATPTPEG